MKWTMCFFVREKAKRQIVHHEIEEIDAAAMPASQRADVEEERIEELMRRYPASEFEVFLQGFSSLEALYSAWPELHPDAAPP